MEKQKKKNPAAVELGRKGGLIGGPARAAKLTPEERHRSARTAALARWERGQPDLFIDGGDRVEIDRNTSIVFPPDKAVKTARTTSSDGVYPQITCHQFSTSKIYLADCFDWMAGRPANSIHAIVTDPPYGLLEFTDEEKLKLRNGRGGIWRIPPSFDGSKRNPLPRFTVLTEDHLLRLVDFFSKWADLAMRILVPGAHVLVATNPLLSDLLCTALRSAGLEKRGEIIRLVQTLRGGDRPKNAHEEFSDITVMPRSGFEPWVVFRKPCEGRVQDNLRKWKSGGLRRISDDQPFRDVIPSSPTRREERALANHPSLKPQAFMRQIVRAALPFGEGVLLDPFMGGGSTIAACVALGYEGIGIENDAEYLNIAKNGIPKLSQWDRNGVSTANDQDHSADAKRPGGRPRQKGR